MSAQFMQMLQNMQGRSSRTVEDMINSDDQLAGMDGMELRGWSHNNPTVPSRDLKDPVGQTLLAIFNQEFDALQNYVEMMIKQLGGTEEARETLRKDLFAKRWGPTKTPIYNVLLPALHMMPNKKQELLGVVKYLANDLKVPVDGKDVVGSTALFWAISTKPYVQPEFAQILFDAGGSVNTKNRFGATPGSEIAQADIHGDTSKNVQMLKWYVEHGGDVDSKDTDGMSIKTLVEMMNMKVPAMAAVLKKGRGPRKEGDCTNCGRSPKDGKVFSACGKCKKARYCSQECQKVDWKGHKKICKAT
ncbi:uncharacterized protein J4E92_006410 [Alternaria infectoria]|uniref:uncharacterized protein n=1 Tax=Alternaria arbusti TaxID=232088 RepID=UPI00221EFDBC|nr:uncharacterized protein J4E86_003744 [Alternaria arbusti]XP_051323768.1 uncharacterized protein J4E85_008074 [Alternaria conjuncta]XP_051352425.1 uncharacterized protein J4E92_006410 [Alternaria infectoria]KAI4923917.1 hypothetical protein J4E85_008074 [Alternaria conjuncta]KAI4927243.1 hypothetical protein J4E92_006410 [Alternaria infectoria]KAI4958148.1 hypothetical protein J4E86_003744 [Alternaria arbusti]